MYKHLIQARRTSLDSGGCSTAVEQLRGLALQAESDQERAAIQKSMLYLEDLGATLDGKAFATQRQLAAQQIREGLLLLTLKSTVGLRAVVKQSLEMCFPGAVTMPKMNSYHRHRVSQFKIDMALALTERDSLMLECEFDGAGVTARPKHLMIGSCGDTDMSSNRACWMSIMP